MIVVFFAHVVLCRFISALESVAIVVAKAALYAGMAIRVVIVSVLVVMAFKVMTRGLDSVVEALSLNLAEFSRRLIPGMILIQSGGGLDERCCMCFGGHQSGRGG